MQYLFPSTHNSKTDGKTYSTLYSVAKLLQFYYIIQGVSELHQQALRVNYIVENKHLSMYTVFPRNGVFRR